MVLVWLIGCVLLAAALPGAILIPNKLLALFGTLAIAGAWLLMLKISPEISVGFVLVYGLWGLSGVGTVVALMIRIFR